MKFAYYIIKRKLEDVLLLPFIGLGRLIARLWPLKQEFETFFFFPFYHTGGAEKVHALVAQATGNPKCIIYFTRKSQNNTFYHDFIASGCVVKDISFYTDNKMAYFLNLVARGVVSGYINRQHSLPVVFNGQCNFAYKLSPWIKPGIPQVELIHSFNTFSWIRLPFLPFISKTIMISQVRIEDHLQQYQRIKVPADYGNRIQYIVNGIPLPQTIQPKETSGQLKVLYVGRGTEEKRVHLVSAMARNASTQNLPVRFTFLGDVGDAIPAEDLAFCEVLGTTNDAEKIDKAYQEAHIVMITSSTEGFPMVVEEGMARGCTIIATPVGDIPIHVKHPQNGFLFSDAANETLIVKEGVDYLVQLCKNRHWLHEIAGRNVEYAESTFGIEAFNRQYRTLFNQLRKQN